MERLLKILDYYFFGIGAASFICALLVLSIMIDFFYVFLLFFLINSMISFLLNLNLLKKLNEVYVWNRTRYIIYHSIVGIISTFLIILSFILVEDVLVLIAYFLSINIFVMLIILFVMTERQIRAQNTYSI